MTGPTAPARVPVAALSAPASTRLPTGFTVRLDRRTRRLDQAASPATALLGGSPGRLMYLAPAAAGLLGADILVVGDPTGAALARRLLDAGLANPIADELRDAPPPAEVTVVVPVRDRPEGLRRLLAGLNATAPGLAQVIVVDDGSRDRELCREVAQAAGAKLLRHEESRGPAAARNTGLSAATTEVVAFLDSDVVPEAGWLPPLLAHLVDPAVAIAAPRIVALPSADPGWLTRYEELRSSLDLGPDEGPVLPLSRVAYVPSAALVARRAALGGGFAEHMPVAEDVDLVLRLHAAGWRLRYEPSARVAHEHRVEPLAWWMRKGFYGTGAAPLALDHPGSVPPAVLSPWTAAACLLVAWQRPRALPAAAVVTAVAAVRLRRPLQRLRHPGRVAAWLAGRGLLGAAGQCAGLLTRHWWPLTVPACLVSRRVRWATLVAAVADGAYDWWTHRPEPARQPAAPAGSARRGLDPVRYLVARRLDDLGYGAGLWLGAYRHRTIAPLLPTVTGLPRRRRR